MAQDVSSYFESGYRQLRCYPKLLIPFLISDALIYGVIGAGMFAFVLVSLPIFGKIAPIIEKNQDLIYKIFREKQPENIAGLQDLKNELASLTPDIFVFLIIFLLIILLIIIVSFVLFSWARAGTIGYIWQGVTSTLNFRNFLHYAKSYLYRIAGLWLLIILFSIVLLLIPFSTLIFIPSPVNIVIFLLSMLLSFILWAAGMLFLFFAEECIVIEDKGTLEAVKRSKEIVMQNLGSVLFFIFILIVIFIIFGAISGIFELIASIFNSSISSVFTLISLIVLSPWVQLAKNNFFLERTGRVLREMDREVEILKTVKEFTRESPGILINFVRNNALYILASLSFYGVGIGIGYYLTHSFSFLGDTLMKVISEFWENKLIGPYISMPVLDFPGYFSQNSMVGINTGLGGLFFGIPSILGIIFIGMITGAFYGMFPAKIATAFLAPHGVFEVTGFVIITAAGIRLGVRFMRGLSDINELLEDTLRVVLATLLLIFIAAFLEAFVTPVVISSLM